MQFYAFIKPRSAIDRAWRAHNRIGGEVSSVLFRFNGQRFQSVTTLDDADVIALRHVPSVQLEMIASSVQTQPPVEPIPVVPEPTLKPEVEESPIIVQQPAYQSHKSKHRR